MRCLPVVSCPALVPAYPVAAFSSLTRRGTSALGLRAWGVFLVLMSSRSGSRLVAPTACRGGVREHQKGESVKAAHVFSFASIQPWAQLVPRSFFPMGATMESHLQREFPLFARMEGPAVVPSTLLRYAKSYRDAVRLCWQLRRVRNMTMRQLAAEAGLPHQHVSDYFNADDKPKRRDLPGDAVAAVETVLGNTAVSQWHAAQARLTVLEELQATRAA